MIKVAMQNEGVRVIEEPQLFIDRDRDMTVDELLRRMGSPSSAEEGNVFVNNRPADSATPVREGDVVISVPKISNG